MGHLSKIILNKIISLLFLCQSQCVTGFLAYDCTSSNLNITAFSTLSVAPCTFPSLTEPEHLPYGKLIQRKEHIFIPYRSCFILVNYYVTRCSAFEDAQIVNGGFFEEYTSVGPHLCARIHDTGVYRINDRMSIDNLRTNNTYLISRTIAGVADNDGNCEGAPWGISGKSWSKVVVQATYHIKLAGGVLIGSTKDGKVIHPSGARYQLKDGGGLETTHGDLVWDGNTMTECESGDFDVLYSGPMSIIRYTNPVSKVQDQDIYVVKNEEMLFALRIEKHATACGFVALKTEHPRLYIITEPYAVMRFNQKDVDPVNMDMTAYINNKLMYLDVSNRGNLEAMYRNLLNQQCELERDLLKTKLGLARANLQEFAYRMGDGPGYTAMTGGEVVYLMKCTPVNVEIRQSPNCFQELQVLYNNKSYYMSPKTHVLQQYGSQVACNRLLPIAYQLSADWYSLSPEISSMKAPQILAPQSQWSWTYESTDTLMKAGIYSSDMMDALQRHMLLPAEVQAASKTLMREAMGYSTYDQGLRFQTVLDETSIQNVVREHLTNMWGWFSAFGNVASGFLGLFFIFRSITLALNMGLNVHLLYDTFGFSIKMVAACFTGVTHYLLRKAEQKDQPVKKEEYSPMYKVVNTQEASHETEESELNDMRTKPIDMHIVSHDASIYPSLTGTMPRSSIDPTAPPQLAPRSRYNRDQMQP